MPDSVTIARPYAKAVFEHAKSTKQLQEWSLCLLCLTNCILDEAVVAFLSNPLSQVEQHYELLISGFAKLDKNLLSQVGNFVATLAHNKRLLVLPAITSLYESMRAEYEKTLQVDVRTYAALSKPEEEHLIEALSKRLKRQVTLQVTVDKALRGGLVIQAKDLVIDGSVAGKINKLRAELIAYT